MIRKIFTNNYFAFFLVVPFTVWFLTSLFSPVFVSAAEFTYNLPESYFSDGASNSEYSPYLNSLKSNSNLSQFSSDKLIVLIRRDGDNLTFFILDPVQQFNTSNSYEGVVFLGDYTQFTCSASLISTYNFTVTAFDSDPLNLQHGVFYNTANWGFDGFAACEGQITSVDNFYCYSFGSYPVFYYTSLVSSYNPTPSINNPLSLNINVDGFYNWLVDTHKDSNFVTYFNLRSLSQYLQFYSAWGSAPQKFLVFYNIEFGDSFGDHLSNTQIISLKNLTDQLYREYLNSLKYPSSDFPARDRVDVRKDIDTNTTDNNTVLITDDSNDSVIVSILRDILRGVIAIKNQIFVTGTDIITGLDNIDFTVNVANDGGTGFSASDIWGSGDITESENYLALTAAFMDKGVDVSVAENMQINYLDNATQQDSFTVSVVMPDEFVNGQFTEKTVTHTIDNTSKMYNTLILFRKLIAFAVVAYFAIRIRFELPHLIRGE